MLIIPIILLSSFIGNCILNKLYNQYVFTKPHLKETICIKKDKSLLKIKIILSILAEDFIFRLIEEDSIRSASTSEYF